jgi:uncharacterized protein YegJ (DUF2314 family)
MRAFRHPAFMTLFAATALAAPHVMAQGAGFEVITPRSADQAALQGVSTAPVRDAFRILSPETRGLASIPARPAVAATAVPPVPTPAPAPTANTQEAVPVPTAQAAAPAPAPAPGAEQNADQPAGASSNEPSEEPARTAVAALAPPEVKDTADTNMKMVNVGNALMREARKRARDSLEEFFRIGSHPPPGSRGFMLKVALRKDSETENIWVGAIERRTRKKLFITISESLSGRLANEPAVLTDRKMGDRVSFRSGDIVDWMYFDAQGKMIGNFSACAIAAMQGSGTIDKLVAEFGLDCTWTRQAGLN